MEVEKIMQALEQKHPGELEYLQAVREVLESIKDVYNQHPVISIPNLRKPRLSSAS